MDNIGTSGNGTFSKDTRIRQEAATSKDGKAAGQNEPEPDRLAWILAQASEVFGGSITVGYEPPSNANGEGDGC